MIHRTLAALLAAFTSIGILAAFEDRPTMEDMIKWIDYETLLLIFSMMVLVAILIDTGIFDYIAVYTFQVNTHSTRWSCHISRIKLTSQCTQDTNNEFKYNYS